MRGIHVIIGLGALAAAGLGGFYYYMQNTPNFERATGRGMDLPLNAAPGSEAVAQAPGTAAMPGMPPSAVNPMPGTVPGGVAPPSGALPSEVAPPSGMVPGGMQPPPSPGTVPSGMAPAPGTLPAGAVPTPGTIPSDIAPPPSGPGTAPPSAP
jgi:hypothetical protein